MTKLFVPHVRHVVAAFVVLAVMAGGAVAAPIEAFYGHYAGQTVTSSTDDTVSARDLDVVIDPHNGDSGFRVTWSTVLRQGGETREKSYTIDFEATARPGIYGSQMRENMFGDRVPLDPMQGEPLVWARLDGDTMTIYAMLITEAGTYDMQIYERTLVPGGLNLTFTRYREGEEVRVVHCFLKRLPF